MADVVMAMKPQSRISKALDNKLLDAAQKGLPTALLAALDSGADIDAVDAQGNTSLHHAARGNFEFCCSKLIAHGADPKLCNHDGESAVSIADKNGFTSLLFMFESALFHFDKTEPVTSTRASTLPMTPDFELPETLHVTTETVKPPATDSYGQPLFDWALKRGEIDTMWMAIRWQGANVNRRMNRDGTGLHPLSFAASIEEGIGSKLVRALIEAGADVNQRNPISGCAPLHHAVTSRNIDSLTNLLCNNAWVDVIDRYSNTPLHVACALGHEEAVRLILFHGGELCDVNARNFLGQTPLASCARAPSQKLGLSCLRHLSSRSDVDPTLADHSGFRPVDYAQRNKYPTLKALLVAMGKRTRRFIASQQQAADGLSDIGHSDTPTLQHSRSTTALAVSPTSMGAYRPGTVQSHLPTERLGSPMTVPSARPTSVLSDVTTVVAGGDGAASPDQILSHRGLGDGLPMTALPLDTSPLRAPALSQLPNVTPLPPGVSPLQAHVGAVSAASTTPQLTTMGSMQARQHGLGASPLPHHPDPISLHHTPNDMILAANHGHGADYNMISVPPLNSPTPGNVGHSIPDRSLQCGIVPPDDSGVYVELLLQKELQRLRSQALRFPKRPPSASPPTVRSRSPMLS